MELSSTVEELIRQCCDPRYRLGSGSWGTVYSLAHIPGLEPFVMRVNGGGSGDPLPSRVYVNRLHHTTTLYPPPRLLGRQNLGQPLLRTPIPSRQHPEPKPTVSFLLRQRGISADQWLDGFIALHTAQRHDSVIGRARIDMYDAILGAAERSGRNPFLPILEMLAHIKKAGFLPQMDERNVLWDGERGEFTLIDQLNNPDRLDNKLDLYDFYYTDPAILTGCTDAVEEELLTKEGKVLGLIAQAQRDVLAKRIHRCPAPFNLAAPKETSGIALSDPPKALIERLRELYAETGIAQAL